MLNLTLRILKHGTYRMVGFEDIVFKPYPPAAFGDGDALYLHDAPRYAERCLEMQLEEVHHFLPVDCYPPNGLPEYDIDFNSVLFEHWIDIKRISEDNAYDILLTMVALRLKHIETARRIDVDTIPDNVFKSVTDNHSQRRLTVGLVMLMRPSGPLRWGLRREQAARSYAF